MVSPDFVDMMYDAERFYAYLTRGRYSKARELVRRALTKHPDDAWLLSELGCAHYEQGRYRLALRYYKRAAMLAPHSAPVLVRVADALDMTGSREDAIDLWKRLLRRGERAVARDRLVGELPEARYILNHCRYRIAVSYEELGKSRLAIRWLEDHLAHRAPGTPANVPLSRVKKELAELQSESSRYRRHTNETVAGLFSRKDYRGARAFIRRALRVAPDDHWLVTTLASAYYEEGKYVAALRHSMKAVSLAPRCPLVLWDHACIIDELGRRQDAIAAWRQLLRRGVRDIAYGECGEGVRWARSLLNDCRYRIGLSYQHLGNTALALRWVKSHIANRMPGIPSIYLVREVKEHLGRLETPAG